MKPVLYSKIEADRHFVGWTRVGDNIRWRNNVFTFSKPFLLDITRMTARMKMMKKVQLTP